MEALQLAQMLADISDLDAANELAADRLARARKTAHAQQPQQQPHASDERSPAASASNTPLLAPSSERSHLTPNFTTAGNSSAPRTTGTSTPFDSYFGRHLLSSSVPASGSFPGTPRGESDSDVDRTSSLMALYELRSKLKQYNDSNSLRQAREKINALSARPKGISQEGLGPTSTPATNMPPLARRHIQYTYPRQ